MLLVNALAAISSIVPSQNTGIDTIASDATSRLLSIALSRYAAATSPITIPRISESDIAHTASSAVAGNRDTMRCVTLSRRMYDLPRSP